ncbi:hypothetical protein SDC9_142716 [bioreactor metagenome]|uniref:Uncharacterized protein n=1 Tax=bioreactor metagenome TaxID=1076179 RepID=A0A645E1X1_9ZZZZ
MIFQKRGGTGPPDKIRMVQNQMAQPRVGWKALDGQLLQRPAHPADRLQPGRGVDQNLCRQRIVVGRQDIAAVQSGVNSYAGAAGEMNEAGRPGAGAEIGRRVLRVDAALDGVAAEFHVLLFHTQGQARGNPDLLAHNVNAGDHLRDTVLHLHPGVHLAKVKLIVLRQQEFHRTGVFIANRLSRADRRRTHFPPKFRGKTPGGSFLDEFLVPALD